MLNWGGSGARSATDPSSHVPQSAWGGLVHIISHQTPQHPVPPSPLNTHIISYHQYECPLSTFISGVFCTLHCTRTWTLHRNKHTDPSSVYSISILLSLIHLLEHVFIFFYSIFLLLVLFAHCLYRVAAMEFEFLLRSINKGTSYRISKSKIG